MKKGNKSEKKSGGFGKFNMDDKSFGVAFKKYKKAGQKTFTWRGKQYSTKTKEEGRKTQKLGTDKSTSAGTGRGTTETQRLFTKRTGKLGDQSKNVSGGRGRGTVDTESLRPKRLKSKLGTDKSVSVGRGRGTVDTGSLRAKRLKSKLSDKKNIRQTKGTGAMFQDARRSDFRTTGQKIKDLDLKDAFKDIKKKLGMKAGGKVSLDGIAIRGKTRCKMK